VKDSASHRAILLTAPHAAAIAVIRFVGPRHLEFLATHCTRVGGAGNPPVFPPCQFIPGRPAHLQLHDGDEVLDDPVVFVAPDGSFSDVSIHGSPWLVQCVLDLAAANGFEILRPALDPNLPLPLDAVDGESVLEREVNAALPLARTEKTVRMLLNQPAAWDALCATSIPNRQAIYAEMLADRTLWHALSPPRVAIVGIPNAGKSTLANALFERERTITADLPGTTRDWVADIAHLDGLPITLIDTPGQRETLDPIESQAITNSALPISSSHLVLLLLDGSRPLGPEQTRLLDLYPRALPVINKSDLPAAWSVDSHLFSVVKPIPIVATTGSGLEQLRRAMRIFFHCDDRPIDAPRFWTARQEEIVLGAQRNPAAPIEL
jgi:small GTP-binding protein